jgi:zinc/manganese transport system permease protein
VVTSFVHVGGVLLAFTFLIVPAVCANYLADSMGARLIIGWLVATVGSLLSLLVTAKLDFPIGATIVCGLAVLLVLTMIVAALRGRMTGPASAPAPVARH